MYKRDTGAIGACDRTKNITTLRKRFTNIFQIICKLEIWTRKYRPQIFASSEIHARKSILPLHTSSLKRGDEGIFYRIVRLVDILTAGKVGTLIS